MEKESQPEPLAQRRHTQQPCRQGKQPSISAGSWRNLLTLAPCLCWTSDNAAEHMAHCGQRCSPNTSTSAAVNQLKIQYVEDPASSPAVPQDLNAAGTAQQAETQQPLHRAELCLFHLCLQKHTTIFKFNPFNNTKKTSSLTKDTQETFQFCVLMQ